MFYSYITYVMRWCIKNSVLWCQTHGWNLNEYKLIANALSKNAGYFVVVVVVVAVFGNF